MAKNFAETKGKATRNTIDAFTPKNGENIIRFVGGVLPRYVYWVKGTNGKDIPIECLSFDRNEEKFNNEEHDWVPAYFPEAKCNWAYSIKCINIAENKVQVFNLKKKLFEAILEAANDLGDPTDEETGWTINFKRAKTGPLPFNVEYTLNTLRCKVGPLTDEQKAMVAEASTIDQEYVRPTPEEVKNLCERIVNGNSEESNNTEEGTEEVNELES